MNKNKLPLWTNEIPEGSEENYFTKAQTAHILRRMRVSSAMLIATCAFIVLTFIWALLTFYTGLHNIAGYLLIGLSGGLAICCGVACILTYALLVVNFKNSLLADGVRLVKQTKNGSKVFELYNERGMSVTLCSYGARLMSLKVPAADGGKIDVVAGFRNADKYADDHGTYMGATVGRYAGRIGGAKFMLDGVEYSLSANENGNHLHGGEEGFDKKQWDAECVGTAGVAFVYTAADGEEGYPGTLKVRVTYTLQEDNTLEIVYSATTDRDTPISLSNHTYFNLDGDFKGLENHILKINADRISRVDDELVPTGEEIAVNGTAYDFKDAKPIIPFSSDVADVGGYDVNYILIGEAPQATLHSAKTGVTMEIHTDCPCMQLYTGNFLDGMRGKGRKYVRHSSVCFETQAFPGADVSAHPEILLKAGEDYHSRTAFKFKTE